MWGKIIIPIYRLWLHGLYGLYGPRCPLSPKRPINLISLWRFETLSRSLWRHCNGPGQNNPCIPQQNRVAHSQTDIVIVIRLGSNPGDPMFRICYTCRLLCDRTWDMCRMQCEITQYMYGIHVGDHVDPIIVTLYSGTGSQLLGLGNMLQTYWWVSARKT